MFSMGVGGEQIRFYSSFITTETECLVRKSHNREAEGLDTQPGVLAWVLYAGADYTQFCSRRSPCSQSNDVQQALLQGFAARWQGSRQLPICLEPTASPG